MLLYHRRGRAMNSYLLMITFRIWLMELPAAALNYGAPWMIVGDSGRSASAGFCG